MEPPLLNAELGKSSNVNEISGALIRTRYGRRPSQFAPLRCHRPSSLRQTFAAFTPGFRSNRVRTYACHGRTAPSNFRQDPARGPCFPKIAQPPPKKAIVAPRSIHHVDAQIPKFVPGMGVANVFGKQHRDTTGELRIFSERAGEQPRT